VVALCGQKGGIGKSTMAICLATEAQSRGRKVLLIDADPQGTTRTWFGVALEAGQPTPSVVALGVGMHKPGQLDAMSAGYDLVLIDCPGRIDAVQRSALLAADLALLPCGPSGTEAWAMAGSVELVAEAQQFRPGLRTAIVITRKKPGTSLGRDSRRALEQTGLAVLQSELCDRVAYQEAVMAGYSVHAYAPKDPAAREVKALCDELFGAPRGRRAS
jgi:chromosome partitioning protein